MSNHHHEKPIPTCDRSNSLTNNDVQDLGLTIDEVNNRLNDALGLLAALKSFIDPALIRIKQNEAQHPVRHHQHQESGL